MPADLTYGGGTLSPAAAQRQAQADPQTAAAVAQKFPVEVQNIAMQFGVLIATAAMMLLNQMQGQPLRAMAQGGHPDAGEPVIVGERGPEVFVPDVPGAIVPHTWPPPPSLLQNDVSSHFNDPWELRKGETGFYHPPAPPPGAPEQPSIRNEGQSLGVTDLISGRLGTSHIDPAAWDAWYNSRPESENIEDGRTPEEIAWDNRIRPKLSPLVQFPPYVDPNKRGPR